MEKDIILEKLTMLYLENSADLKGKTPEEIYNLYEETLKAFRNARNKAVQGRKD